MTRDISKKQNKKENEIYRLTDEEIWLVKNLATQNAWAYQEMLQAIQIKVDIIRKFIRKNKSKYEKLF